MQEDLAKEDGDLLAGADKLTPKDQVRAKMQECEPLSASYWTLTLAGCLRSFSSCCCCKKYCSTRCKRHLDSHKKMQVAQERLDAEYDIVNMLLLNRITRLLHKTNLSKRQRKTLTFSHKYVISASDVSRAGQPDLVKKSEESAQAVDQLLDGFNPEVDAVDRRLLFEITGRELEEGEFAEDDSSDEQWSIFNCPDPQAYAFAYN